MNLTIDVTSDVICPWCYVGKRRLENAILLSGPDDVIVRWHPFQLNPQMPKTGMKRKEYRTTKFGRWERSLTLDAQVAAAGRTEGIEFAHDRIERTPNTRDAHRLVWLADKEGVQDAVVEAVFRGYFTDGKDISDATTLLGIVAEAGLDRELASALLSSNDGVAEVQAAEERARLVGVRGVPYFIINDSVALSGAMESSAFVDAFNRAGVKKSSSSEGGVCKIASDGEPSC